MTTPAPATVTPARPAAPATPAAPAPDSGDRTDALSAAVAAIARHITGTEHGHEHEALTALGLTDGQAEAIAGKPVT